MAKEGKEPQKLVEPGLLFCDHPLGQSWTPHAPTSPSSPPAGARLSPSACSTNSGYSTPPGLRDRPHDPWVAERWTEGGIDSCGDWMRMPIGARSAPARSGGWWWAALFRGGRVWHRGAEDAEHSGPTVGQDVGNGWDEDRQKSCHDWIGQVSE